VSTATKGIKEGDNGSAVDPILIIGKDRLGRQYLTLIYGVVLYSLGTEAQFQCALFPLLSLKCLLRETGMGIFT